MNECIGCPPYEDGLKSKEMCGWCELFEDNNHTFPTKLHELDICIGTGTMAKVFSTNLADIEIQANMDLVKLY